MSQNDPLTLLSESAARVHLLAREGLGLPGLEVLHLRNPWRAVAARFLEQTDGDYFIDELIRSCLLPFAHVAELSLDSPALAEETRPAWEAVARHLTQWVNALEEEGLRDLEASEEPWKEWARQRGRRLLVEGT